MSDWLEIHGLADEQLSDAERARAQQRVSSDDQSARELQAIHAVKDVLQTRRDAILSDEVWAKCQRRLDEVDKAQRIEGFVGRYAWGLCGLFLAMIIGVGVLNRSGESMAAADVPRIAAGLTPFLSKPASGDARVQQRFVEATAAGAPIRMVPKSGVTLMRGASARLDGRRVVRLDFADQQGTMVLYAIEDANFTGLADVPGSDEFDHGRINEINCVTWGEDGYGFALAGKRPVNELCEFADSVRDN